MEEGRRRRGPARVWGSDVDYVSTIEAAAVIVDFPLMEQWHASCTSLLVMR